MWKIWVCIYVCTYLFFFIKMSKRASINDVRCYGRGLGGLETSDIIYASMISNGEDIFVTYRGKQKCYITCLLNVPCRFFFKMYIFTDRMCI